MFCPATYILGLTCPFVGREWIHCTFGDYNVNVSLMETNEARNCEHFNVLEADLLNSLYYVLVTVRAI